MRDLGGRNCTTQTESRAKVIHSVLLPVGRLISMGIIRMHPRVARTRSAGLVLPESQSTGINQPDTFRHTIEERDHRGEVDSFDNPRLGSGGLAQFVGFEWGNSDIPHMSACRRSGQFSSSAFHASGDTSFGANQG